MKPVRPPIRINGTPITAAMIAAEAQHHPAPAGKPGLAWRSAAVALALRELLLQEARRRGLVPEPREVAPGRKETDEEALVRQLLDEAVEPGTPSPEELRLVWARDPGRYRAPTLHEAAHILFPAAAGDAAGREAARARALSVLAELQREPGRFGALARAHSACPSREAGGRLGQLCGGDTVPELEAALEALEPGSIAAEPVETRYGVHLLRLDARVRGAVLPFESVAPRLREAYQKAAWLRAARDFSVRLARGAEITGIDLEAA